MHYLLILDRLLYGSIFDPCFMRYVSCIMNYCLIAIFFQKIKYQKGALKALAASSGTTIAIYHIMPASAGMSTLWSFSYGYLAQRHITDHILFWLPCSSVIVPWMLHHHTMTLFNFRFWPYGPSYIYIATAAHLLFAYFGFLFGRYQREHKLHVLGFNIPLF